jgi:hypothetical protein
VLPTLSVQDTEALCERRQLTVAVSSDDVAIEVEFERCRGLGGMMDVLCGAWMGFALCAASINGVAPFLSGLSIVCGNARHR